MFALAGLLGFGPITFALRCLLWVGGKTFSLFSSTSMRTGSDLQGLARVGVLATKPKTQEVASEMSHITTQLQGSWFSPIKVISIVCALLLVGNILAYFWFIPAWKKEAKIARLEAGAACAEGDKRELCIQMFQIAENATSVYNKLVAANERIEKLQGDAGKQFANLNKTVQGEKARATKATKRVEEVNSYAKRVGNGAASSAGGVDLSVDEYRSLVLDTWAPTSVVDSDTGGAKGTSGVASGVRPGADGVQDAAAESGAASAEVKPAISQ